MGDFGNDKTSLDIFDLKGKIVKSTVFRTRTGESGSLDLSALPCGFYVVKVGVEGSIIHASKILLTR